jgi:DNA mismatch repair protein MutS2
VALLAATPRSLVLLDELGAGTDPEEGAALAWAMLTALYERHVPTVVSTHLGKLKDFAYEHPGVENGAMAFDPDELRPLYRLDVGVPGESQALHIARAIGIAPEIVEAARGMLAQRDRRLEEIIGKVERTRRAAEQHRQQAEAIHKEAAGRAVELQEKEAAADRRQTWIHEEAEHFVDEELRAARELLREPLKQFLNAPHPYDEKARGMLALLDGLLSRSSLGRRREQFVGELKKGFVVYVPRFRRRGDVLKIDRKRRLLTVKLGDLTLELPFDEVSWLQPLDSQ